MASSTKEGARAPGIAEGQPAGRAASETNNAIDRKEDDMTESTNAIQSLKKAANYTKLAMRKEGPRSFKRGQGALIKVIYKFGEGTLDKDTAKKTLGWRGCDVRAVAKKAADNGYLTISDPKDGFIMALTQMGTEVIQKRLEAEDKAADEIMGNLTDQEKQTLIELCGKIAEKAEEMGVDYSRIQKKRGMNCGRKCGCKGKHDGGCGKKGHGHHEHCHEHDHHDAPKYVFVFEDGGCGHEHGGHDHGCKKHGKH